MIRPLIFFLVCLVLATSGFAALYLYNIPKGEFERLEVRHLATLGEYNVFGHGRDLVDHTFTAIVRPNNDTLYSSTFLDLSNGPLMLALPEMGERYYSVQFMDPMTNVYEVISRRTHGGRGGTYVIVGPGYRGATPSANDVVRAPTDRAWVLIRILIDGEEDLAAVHALQDQISLTPARP